MATGLTATRRKDKPTGRGGSPQRPFHPLSVILAVVLVVAGLLLFSQAQTQPLFQGDGDTAMNAQSPRDDGAIFTGAFLAVTGLTVLLWLLSPLRPMSRLLPAGIFAASNLILLGAHGSIFTNGMALPERDVFSIQSTYLFNDTASAVPIATFSLAMITLLVLAVAGFSALALLTPRLLTERVLRPRTLDGHRARLFVVTLILFGTGSAFVRQFFAYGFGAAADLNTRTLGMAYLLMGILLTTLLASVAWRTIHSLWGDLNTWRDGPARRKHERALHLEVGVWGLLLVFTAIILLGEPVWVPHAGTDPVFTMNSIGVSWVFLAVLGIYVIHRVLTRTYNEHLKTSSRPLPRIGRDRLLGLGLFVVTAWILGGLWALASGQSPLTALTLRTLPIVLALPFFALWPHHPGKTPGTPSGRGVLVFSWIALSVLTGIMLWGIGNSVDVRFNGFSGGLNLPEDGLISGSMAALRLLGSLLIVAPIIIGLRLIAQTQSHRPPLGTTLLIGATGVFILHVLFTITPTNRFDTVAGDNLVLVTTWANSLATPSAIAIVGTLIAMSAAMGLLAMTRLLHRSSEAVPPPRPRSTEGILEKWSAKVRRADPIRHKERQARGRSRPSAMEAK